MPPTFPCFRSPRGGAAIAISTSSESTSFSESYHSFGNTLVILSSTSVVMVPDSSDSRGSDEANRGEQRCAPRHRRSPSPAPSAVPVRSATVATAASYFSGSSGQVATRRSPSPCSVLRVRASGGGVVPASPSRGGGGGDDDEATSRPKRKVRYRKWGVEDELKVLTALAELRRENLGVAPQASVLLDKIRADGGLLRGGVDATDLSDKVCKLKKKFANAANKFAASGGKRVRNYRNRVLFRTSMEVWPDLLPGSVAAAFLLQVA